MIIRLEEEKDYFETENLTREAFWNVYREGCFEHLIIHNLRKDKSFVKELDYCIEIDNKIIANIVYAKGKLKLEKTNHKHLTCVLDLLTSIGCDIKTTDDTIEIDAINRELKVIAEKKIRK